ncbi:MAG: SseB family protein [Flavobacteriaceae bacterium]|jgi:tetratricopeptide (TPR) repeat protein|nr:SseB family protein [Flavobacteriaceae bacterium]
MGLFDLFKKKKNTNTFPENELEKCLINKDIDTNALKAFYLQLLYSELIVLHRGDTNTPTEGENTKVQIITFENGMIPVFTSLNRIYDNGELQENMPYITLTAQDLFQFTLGNTLILNPYTPNSKVLVPEEINDLLDGSIYSVIDDNIKNQDIDEQDIEQFNLLYNQALKDQEGLTILGGEKECNLDDNNIKRLEDSINGFKKALELYPNHWPSMFLMAKSYQALHRHPEALDMLEQACSIELENPDVPREASIEAMYCNNLNKTMSYSEEALRRAPDDHTLMANHAANLILIQKDNEALALINQALLIEPNDPINQNIKSIIDKVITGEMKRPNIEDMI